MTTRILHRKRPGGLSGAKWVCQSDQIVGLSVYHMNSFSVPVRVGVRELVGA